MHDCGTKHTAAHDGRAHGDKEAKMIDGAAKKEERIHRFNEEERRGLYRAIYDRRDVRSHFISTPIPDEVLARLLDAAHHAPSVGFMQPWNFIIIQDRGVRAAVRDAFLRSEEHTSELQS